MTNKAATPEPAPIGNGHVIVTELLKDILARDGMGREKYGTSLRVGNGRDALNDSLQEALDLCFYLKQAIMERDDAGRLQNNGLCDVKFHIPNKLDFTSQLNSEAQEIVFDMPKLHKPGVNPDVMDEYIERLKGRNHE